MDPVLRKRKASDDGNPSSSKRPATTVPAIGSEDSKALYADGKGILVSYARNEIRNKLGELFPKLKLIISAEVLNGTTNLITSTLRSDIIVKELFSSDSTIPVEEKYAIEDYFMWSASASTDEYAAFVHMMELYHSDHVHVIPKLDYSTCKSGNRENDYLTRNAICKCDNCSMHNIRVFLAKAMIGTLDRKYNISYSYNKYLNKIVINIVSVIDGIAATASKHNDIMSGARSLGRYISDSMVIPRAKFRIHYDEAL
jgi:hypothetical protein